MICVHCWHTYLLQDFHTFLFFDTFFFVRETVKIIRAVYAEQLVRRSAEMLHKKVDERRSIGQTTDPVPFNRQEYLQLRLISRRQTEDLNLIFLLEKQRQRQRSFTTPGLWWRGCQRWGSFVLNSSNTSKTNVWPRRCQRQQTLWQTGVFVLRGCESQHMEEKWNFLHSFIRAATHGLHHTGRTPPPPQPPSPI